MDSVLAIPESDSNSSRKTLTGMVIYPNASSTTSISMTDGPALSKSSITPSGHVDSISKAGFPSKGPYTTRSTTTAYEPYFTPLVKVCSYLDVFVQLVSNMGIKDDLNVLIPQAAVLLDEPESMVGQTLQTHRKQLLEVGAIDSIIRESNFYKTWVPDPAEPSGKLRARSPSPDDFEYEGDDFEYEGDDTFTDDMEPTFDSETDVQSSHNNRHHGHSHEDDTSNSDVNSSPPAPAASETPLPIVSHDMADCEVIPDLKAEVEADDEFFSEINGSARRTISAYMEFISSKFGPPSTLCSPEQRSFFVQYRDAPENHVES
ncbi:hypothetical protein BGZ88_010031 [Linnemannia elongata]|nr:hypothetical protein BGZ88_010031 [Linnemannia elongata]